MHDGILAGEGRAHGVVIGDAGLDECAEGAITLMRRLYVDRSQRRASVKAPHHVTAEQPRSAGDGHVFASHGAPPLCASAQLYPKLDQQGALSTDRSDLKPFVKDYVKDLINQTHDPEVTDAP